jgi:hypothetical protein
MKKTALTLIIILAFLLLRVHTGYATELSPEIEEEALHVITNVIGLDTTKYSTQLYNHNSHSPDGYGGLIQEDVAYTLSTTDSQTLAICTFINQELVSWDLVPLGTSEFLPLYSQPLPSSKLDVVKQTLQRGQEYLESPMIREALATIEGATDMETGNVTVGDLTMRIAGDYIDWVRTINSLEFPTGLSIRLSNGFVDMFNDESSFYRIGNAEVNISRGEAARIALEEARTFTAVEIWLGDHDEVFLFSVKEEPSIVRLQVGTTNLTSYPYWYVWFVADSEVYSVTGVEVSIRADTGEIAYSQTTAAYGDASPNAPPTPSPEPIQVSDPFSTTLVIGSAVAVAAVVGLGLMVYLKKRPRKTGEKT